MLLGLLDWAWPSKRYRSQILTLREEEFTQTAIFSGMSTLKIILREHFPFLLPFALADMVSGFLFAIGMEITLAILGLSDLQLPTIGTMIYWANYYQSLLAPLVVARAANHHHRSDRGRLLSAVYRVQHLSRPAHALEESCCQRGRRLMTTLAEVKDLRAYYIHGARFIVHRPSSKIVVQAEGLSPMP